MAIVAPALITITCGQDATITTTVPTNTTGWTIQADFRYFNGGTAWATKSTTAGSIVNTPGSSSSTIVTTITAADTTGLLAGGYSWGLTRTDTGQDYPITDSSACRLLGGIGTANPTFTNLSEFWAARKPVDRSDAAAIQDLQYLAAAETFVHRYCGRRKFFYGTYTDWLTPNLNGGPVNVSETPIWSITSINVDPTGGFGQLDNTFGTDTLLTAGTDYYFSVDDTDGKGHRGAITCLRNNGWGYWGWGGFWGGGGWGGSYTPGLIAGQPQPTPGAIKIVYTGGYALIPDDLRSAIWQMAAWLRMTAALGVPFQSESSEGYSYSLGQHLPTIGDVESILAGYRHGDTYVA